MVPPPHRPSLKTALATVHRDPQWWRKTLIGGALWLTILGYPVVEGYQAESIENTQNGYSSPLPLWNALGDKAVIGLFALVIDFFYFVLPLLFTALLLLCVTAGLILADVGTDALGLGAGLAAVAGAGWIAFVWLSSASPVGKQLYVTEGQPAIALSLELIRRVWHQPARTVYLRARLQSLPVYLLPAAFIAAAVYTANASAWLVLLLTWLGLSALLYARLVVIQLYAAAARELQHLAFERLQAQTRR